MAAGIYVQQDRSNMSAIIQVGFLRKGKKRRMNLAVKKILKKIPDAAETQNVVIRGDKSSWIKEK